MARINVDIDEDVFLECYRHLIDESQFFDIDFLYGGRDSGKSRHVAMQLVIDCMRPGYFKCLLIRKVLDTVRGSQFDLIKSVIDEWGISHLFRVNESRMEIICKANKNGFYGRGLDDVGKIKSFNNPSHCWVEEGNQIDSTDFVVILTSLRAKVRVKTWFTFNPECDKTYTEFWLWQEYFSHTEKLSWEWVKEIPVPVETLKRYPDGKYPGNVKVVSDESGGTQVYMMLYIRATHSTYKDNPYCSPQRIALYESYKGSKNNSYWYQTYTLGLWGFKKTGGSFWKSFDEGIHTGLVAFNPKLPVHLTIDNNVHPYVTLAMWQIDREAKRFIQVAELPCVSPDNTAVKAAKQFVRWLDRVGHEEVVFIYGDPSANAKSTTDDDGRSFFDKFKLVLKTEKVRFLSRIEKSAPEVAMSGSFINEIYESNFEGWSILIGSNNRKSIEDYTMTKEDMDGRVLKQKVKDKESGITYEQYGHFTDTKRYLICTVLKREFNIYKARGKRRGSQAA